MGNNTITEIIDRIGLSAANEMGQAFGENTFGSGWNANDMSRMDPIDDTGLRPDLAAKGWFPSYATEDEKQGQSPIDDHDTMLLVCAANIVEELRQIKELLQGGSGTDMAPDEVPDEAFEKHSTEMKNGFVLE